MAASGDYGPLDYSLTRCRFELARECSRPKSGEEILQSRQYCRLYGSVAASQRQHEILRPATVNAVARDLIEAPDEEKL